MKVLGRERSMTRKSYGVNARAGGRAGGRADGRAGGRAEIIENIEHRKDAQRNCVQKDVLNSSPSFFSNLFVKKPLVLKSVFPLFHVPAENESSAFRIRDLSVWPF